MRVFARIGIALAILYTAAALAEEEDKIPDQPDMTAAMSVKAQQTCGSGCFHQVEEVPATRNRREDLRFINWVEDATSGEPPVNYSSPAKKEGTDI
jgi:hypothetical protein